MHYMFEVFVERFRSVRRLRLAGKELGCSYRFCRRRRRHRLGEKSVKESEIILRIGGGGSVGRDGGRAKVDT